MIFLSQSQLSAIKWNDTASKIRLLMLIILAQICVFIWMKTQFVCLGVLRQLTPVDRRARDVDDDDEV